MATMDQRPSWRHGAQVDALITENVRLMNWTAFRPSGIKWTWLDGPKWHLPFGIFMKNLRKAVSHTSHSAMVDVNI
jgi:hypothetical protein